MSTEPGSEKDISLRTCMTLLFIFDLDKKRQQTVCLPICLVWLHSDTSSLEVSSIQQTRFAIQTTLEPLLTHHCEKSHMPNSVLTDGHKHWFNPAALCVGAVPVHNSSECFWCNPVSLRIWVHLRSLCILGVVSHQAGRRHHLHAT